MDLFRRKQKLIFWIVTLIIVPSFVLVWGVGGMGDGSGNNLADFDMGRVDGKTIKFNEYDAFRKRILAALGGMNFQFSGAPGYNTPSEDLWKYLFTYALLRDAEKAGSKASDMQVGTYLENGHPTLAVHKGNRQAMEKAVNALCAQMQISRAEFLQGVRDWQTIGNYLDADSNLSAVNDSTAYAFYAVNRSEVVIKRVRILESDAVKEQAKKDVMEKPAEELEREVRDYVARNADKRKYRDSAGWRFAYVFTPFGAETSVREPSDADVQEYYDANKTYLYSGKALDEVRDQVKAAVRRTELERQTLRNFQIDIDPQLRTQADLDLGELVKLTPLAKYGVTAGVTGEDLLPPGDVVKQLPAGVDSAFRMLLEDLDDAFKPEDKDATLKMWRAGYLLEESPFRAENGFFRLRLLDYRPSTPTAIDDAEGKIKPEIFEMAVADMVGERADKIVEESAAGMEQKIHALMLARESGEDAPDAEMAAQFDALPTQTITYMELGDSNYAMGRLEIGATMGPNSFDDPAKGESGQEIIVMVGRRVPSRETYAAESATVKNEFWQIASSNFRGGLSFTYTMNGPMAVIQPSPTAMGAIADRFNRGEITVNSQLLASVNEG